MKRPRRCVSSGEENRRAKRGFGAIRLWRNRSGGDLDMKKAPLWAHYRRSPFRQEGRAAAQKLSGQKTNRANARPYL